MQRAERIEATVRNHPFAGVLAALLSVAGGPEPAQVNVECLAAIRHHPEILTWA
jgi:hypothetical protein